MAKYIIDIETAGTNRSDVIEYLTSKIAPPKNYKTEEAVRKWWATAGAEKIAEVKNATALSGTWGRIVGVGISQIDNDKDNDKNVIIVDSDELVALNTINDEITSGDWLIGHNIAGFDIQYIYQRAIINGMRELAVKMRHILHAKFYVDTMYEWTLDWRKRVSLKEIAFALGAEVDFEDDGANVPMWFEEGNLHAIERHLENDIALTRFVYERMML